MKLVGTPKELIPKMLNLPEDKKYELKEFKEKRSLNANNYAWALMEKMAQVLKSSKDEIYELMLQRYGTLYRDEEGDLIVIPTDKELKSTSKLHLKFIGQKIVNGKLLNLYAVIKGSSEYDTKEMAVFIDGIVSECKELEIETMTPTELSLLKSRWDNAK